MLMSPQNYAANLDLVRSRIAQAAGRVGRDWNSITLIAVSKGQPVEAIQTLQRLGVKDFGESYLQEFTGKMQVWSEKSAATASHARLNWHFIGHVQSNKTRHLAEHFDWVHSVDRLQIARRLNDQRPFHATPLNVCLEVKLEVEAAKAGATPQGLAELAVQVAALARLRVRGLMCVPPATDDKDHQRGYFRRMRELLDELNSLGLNLDTLSMGMSGDFEIAVEEGATHVRIGTGLFGPRA